MIAIQQYIRRDVYIELYTEIERFYCTSGVAFGISLVESPKTTKNHFTMGLRYQQYEKRSHFLTIPETVDSVTTR